MSQSTLQFLIGIVLNVVEYIQYAKDRPKYQSRKYQKVSFVRSLS